MKMLKTAIIYKEILIFESFLMYKIGDYVVYKRDVCIVKEIKISRMILAIFYVLYLNMHY